MGIFGRASRRASAGATAAAAAAAVVAAIACGGGSPPAGTAPAVTPVRTLPLSALYVLQSSGPAPADTTDTLIAGQARHVLLRAGEPDNTTFADVFFGDTAFTAPPGTRVTVTLRPRPQTYGLDIAASAPIVAGTVTFKYAVHFQGSPEAVGRYGSAPLLERALAIGVIGAGDRVTLLATMRPAADNLQTAFTTAGSYIVAAPR